MLLEIKSAVGLESRNQTLKIAPGSLIWIRGLTVLNSATLRSSGIFVRAGAGGGASAFETQKKTGVVKSVGLVSCITKSFFFFFSSKEDFYKRRCLRETKENRRASSIF